MPPEIDYEIINVRLSPNDPSIVLCEAIVRLPRPVGYIPITLLVEDEKIFEPRTHLGRFIEV
jgi:hypothetical protein